MIYRLVSTNRKRVIESPFCLGGERIAAFYLEEAALRVARMLRESDACPTVYGCYIQPNGSFLIGPASARAAGKYRQTLALREVTEKINASVEVWKSVTAGRVSGPLDAFARACLGPSVGSRLSVSRSRR